MKLEEVIELFERKSYRKHPMVDLSYGVQEIIRFACAGKIPGRHALAARVGCVAIAAK